MFVIIGADGKPFYFRQQYDRPVAAFSTEEKAQAYIDFYIDHLHLERDAVQVEIKPLDQVREMCRRLGHTTYFPDPRPVGCEGEVKPL